MKRWEGSEGEEREENVQAHIQTKSNFYSSGETTAYCGHSLASTHLTSTTTWRLLLLLFLTQRNKISMAVMHGNHGTQSWHRMYSLCCSPSSFIFSRSRRMSLEVMRFSGSAFQQFCIIWDKSSGQRAGIARRCTGEGEQQMHTQFYTLLRHILC